MLEGMGNYFCRYGLDASTVMNCLVSKWNESWNLFADMIMHPALMKSSRIKKMKL
jgi:hypothetical protein